MLETADPSPLEAALAARTPFVEADHRGPFRLFNGHLEGDARFVLDVYARTLVVTLHAERTANVADDLATVIGRVLGALPWLDTVVVKEREAASDEARRGRIAHQRPGSTGPDRVVEEHGVRYAIDLTMNQDASFYLDTRGLRRWLLDHAAHKTVLNLFAYTGSLGVAARAGGAARVVQTDLNPRFLNVAKASYALNGFPVERRDFQARDFWSFVKGLKLRGERYDIVVLDPPFFSSTRGGTVDLNQGMTPLINKVRPVVTSGGTLAVVNNSLFVPGAAFLQEIEALCEGGWLALDRIVDVPADVAGYPSTRRGEPVADPAPFVHSTKIVLLNVRHRA